MFFTPEPSIQHLILLSSLSPPDSRGPCLVAEAFCQVSFFKILLLQCPHIKQVFYTGNNAAIRNVLPFSV